ncbi:MAG: ribbon-helix-helix protein, CopG family [Nanoarchaeota archaeon]
MTTMINLKLEPNFLKKIDNTVKQRNYQSRTELIREAIREKLDKEEMILNLKKLKGSIKTISEFDREKAARELIRKERKGKNLFEEIGL